MCELPKDATLRERLAHDFKNSYYRLITLYIAFFVTLIFLSVVLGWGAA